MASVIVGLVLALLVAWAVRNIFNRKGSCGCGSASCTCHKRKGING